jgi:hypothetical protein
MGNVISAVMRKLGHLFTRFPKDAVVRPDSFIGSMVINVPDSEVTTGTVVIQSVPDKFYFLLFGAIREKLSYRLNGPAELLVVRSVSGAVGEGFLAEIKRSSLVAWLWSAPWVRAYGPLIRSVAYRSAALAQPWADWLDWRRSRALWKSVKSQSDGLSLVVEGIKVGDLVVDSYLRFKPSPCFDVGDPFVRRLIWQALRDVRLGQAYFRSARPKLYLTSYSTYIEHGVAVRVALQAGVQVWSFGNLGQFGKRLSLKDPYHTADFSHYRSSFEALEGQGQRLDDARERLEFRLSGGVDAATSYMRQSAYGKSVDDLPEGLDGAVVIFLHDFYDSPHVYPEMVFHDFWRWICFTIEVLQKNGINFFLKPHPNQIAMSDEALAALSQLYPDLKWLTTGVSNVALARAGITCGVTVYGTVAHELAYMGVPSIGCARHPHHTFDFCRTARTREEYECMLQTHALMPVPKEEMQRQALAFYYMHNLSGADDERQLTSAFLAFWKACNVGDSAEEAVMRSFHDLVGLPAFVHFVASTIKDDMRTGGFL